MSHTIYNLMLDYADHIDMINIKETHTDEIALARHIDESFSVFCRGFTECVEGDFQGAVIDCVYDERGVAEFILSADGTPEYLNSVARLYKLKPNNFPYTVRFLREAKQKSELSELTTCIMSSKGDLVKVADTKAIEIGFIPERTGSVKAVVFYQGDSAYRFVVAEAKAMLTHSIGEFAYISNISGLYILPSSDDMIECERVRVKNLTEQYEKACWKVGVQAYPDPKLEFN